MSEAYNLKFRELQGVFLTRMLQDISRIAEFQQALRDAQPVTWAQYERFAHRYHGNGRTFGFSAVSSAAALLEEALKSRKSITALEAASSVLAEAMREAVKSLAKPS